MNIRAQRDSLALFEKPIALMTAKKTDAEKRCSEAEAKKKQVSGAVSFQLKQLEKLKKLVDSKMQGRRKFEVMPEIERALADATKVLDGKRSYEPEKSLASRLPEHDPSIERDQLVLKGILLATFGVVGFNYS